jgi:nucleotide-binding universal stress UspA family protein
MNRPKKILVTTDGSARSRQVLPHAAEFARACGAEILLLQVLNPRSVARRPAEALEQSLTSIRGQLARTIQRAGIRATPLAIPLLVGEDVPSAILRVAHDEGAGMLAIASRGRGLSTRMLFGSVATAVLGRSQFPIMTTGPGLDYPTTAEPYRVLFTSDGSSASAEVFRRLAPMLESTQIAATLLRVYLPALGDRGERAEVEAAHLQLCELAGLLPGSSQIDTIVDTKRTLGGPVDAIVEKAASLGVNALAVSTRGHSLSRDFLMGSVALEVCRRSPLPVILASVR